MKLFSKRYREVFAKKAEEEKSADEIYEDRMSAAAERLEDAKKAVQVVKRERVAMNAKYHLSWNSWGVPSCGFGNFESATEVAVWWRDFRGREDRAIVEFNAALLAYSALKKPEVSVSHLDGSEHQRNYRIVR